MAAEQPPSLLLCHEDRDAYPWSMADGSGLNRQLLARVERALPVQFRYVALPWRRCLDGVARGLYDGAFAASFNLERTKGAVYPLTAQGLPERGKRLHTATYALYRRIGQGPEWDGAAFHRLDGRIGSLSGFSIVDFLRARGAEVDETSRDPLALLSMVKNRRIEAAALQVLRADFILKAHPELNDDLEKAEIPLEVKDYYLVFSPHFAAQRPQVVRQIWDSIEDQRESLGYQANIKAFMSQ
ncbi:transporter substrate-binding domain-containing protein [Pseudomonas sp. RIT-PI-AD]|uniref:substrate-binding periplasmic protein n=1 Tax=Pseudomonas sp. RIT-PI-AD TaxID=3035294 RepID=UPI0021D887CF|nr:transporter substrate-binding domain-containing protein [Pseudomonas sp. RIT-PI-AD]